MIDVYEKTLDNAGRLIAGVKASQLADATPCKNFKVKDLLNHIAGDCYFFSMIGSGQQIDTSAPTPDLIGDDPVTAFDAAKKVGLDAFRASGALEKSWPFPFGEMSGQQAIGIAITEAVVHGWDLAKATGQEHGIDDGLAALLLQGGRQALTQDWRNEEGDPFGAEVTVPDSADNVAKLVAFYGRKP
jgi:uncharacterized protein (TIGR03086 family)